MCIGIPMKVVERGGDFGKVEMNGVIKDVSFELLPMAKVGDYVLIHAGFAIETMSEEEAGETLRLFSEIFGEGEGA